MSATKATKEPLSFGESLTTAFCTGASVMIIEILGTRVISPVFGVSLFVWSALLAVTLARWRPGTFLEACWSIGGLPSER